MTECRSPAVVAGLLRIGSGSEPHLRMPLQQMKPVKRLFGAIFTGIGVGLAAVAVISGVQVVVSRVANRGEKTGGAEANIQPSTTSQVEDEAASPKRVAAASNFRQKRAW